MRTVLSSFKALALITSVIIIAGAFIFVFAATTSSLSPTADGGNDSASWTNSSGVACSGASCYIEVDETSGGSCSSSSDGDTSYIQSNTQGANQTFDILESSIPDGATITGIDVKFCYIKGDPGAENQFQARYCIDGICSNSGVDITAAGSYTSVTQSFSGLNIIKNSSTDVEVGASLTGSKNKQVRISAISGIVTYSTTPSDTVAPNAVTDLVLSGATQTTINVSWTAPGDDGSSGTATSYDLRYSASIINDGNFDSAVSVSGEPTPSVSGTTESMTVSGLTANTLYYFALKTTDESTNTSAISNLPSISTTDSADTVPPSNVTDFAAINTTSSSVTLSWTAPGGDGNSGTAGSYDVRYSTSIIDDGNWPSATQATGEPTPSISGSSETYTLSGLSGGTPYYVAFKASDGSGNESGLSNVVSFQTDATSSVSIPTDGAGGVQASTIRFSGRAYPGSSPKILTRGIKDIFVNVPLESFSVDEDGFFIAQTLGLLGGDYFVVLQITDKDGNKTDFISFNVDLLSSNLIVEDMIIAPTIHIASQEFKKGEDVNISGYGIPETTLELKVDDEVIKTIELGSDGSYDLSISTVGLSEGTHYARVRTFDSNSDTYSAFSSPRAFKATKILFPEADFNKDDNINVTDWSIFLSRWGSSKEEDLVSIDLNKDGKVDVSDLSVFLRAINI